MNSSILEKKKKCQSLDLTSFSWYKYTAILYNYLYGGKPVCRTYTGRRTHPKLSHPPFIDEFTDYSNWIINLLLDVLVCSITTVVPYFDEPYGIVKIGHNSKKYTAILHIKTVIRYKYSQTFLKPRVLRKIFEG